MSDDRLLDFLKMVPHAHWRQPPFVWGEQLRRAMSENLVMVGWGGILKLTDAGHDAVTNGNSQ